MANLRDAYICDFARTPIGRYGGSLSKVRADDLAAVPIKALVARNKGLDKKVPRTVLACGRAGTATLAPEAEEKQCRGRAESGDEQQHQHVREDDYEQAVAQLIPKPSAEAQSMLANMETKFESKTTGRKETIQGIVAEERQIVMTMSAKAATEQETPGQLMRMVLNIWSAAPSEAARVPALGEIERIEAIESGSEKAQQDLDSARSNALPEEDESGKAKRQSLNEQALVEARSELQKAFSALENSAALETMSNEN